MSLASFDAAHSMLSPPDYQGWCFRKCLGGPGPVLWTEWQLSPERLVACPCRAHRRFVSPNQRSAGEVWRRTFLLSRDVAHVHCWDGLPLTVETRVSSLRNTSLGSISPHSVSPSRTSCFMRSASGSRPSSTAYGTCSTAQPWCRSTWLRLAGLGF